MQQCFINEAIRLNNLKVSQTIFYFDEAIKIDPEFANAWHNKGITFLNQMNMKKQLNVMMAIQLKSRTMMIHGTRKVWCYTTSAELKPSNAITKQYVKFKIHLIRGITKV